MKRSIFSSILCVGWLTTACHASPDEPLDTPSERVADSDGVAVVEPGQAPADVATLTALLQARHADDLPSAEALAGYPSAEASLRYLGEHADTMLVRGRALTLLRHFDSAASGELLASYAADPELHPALRAAALTGLAGQALADQPERLAVVIAALHDADPRVGLAAVELLDGFAAGRKALRAAKAEPDLSKAVREAIESR